MSLREIEEYIIHRELTRRRIGWVDFSSGSWDRRVSRARAWRILQRLRGTRMTLQEALKN